MAKRQPQSRNARPSQSHDERNPPPHGDDSRAPEQSATGFNPFLKVEDVEMLGDGPQEFSLTGWTRRTVGRFGPQIVIEVVDSNGKLWDFGIKEGSPNHRMIFRACGRDESQWNARIVVEIETFKMKGGRTSNPAIGIREVIPQ